MDQYFLPILECVRDSILTRAPALAQSFHRLAYVEEPGAVVPRTDGFRFLMDPLALRAAFKSDEPRLRYTLLHTLAHVLLGHLAIDCSVDSRAYTLAIDLLAARFVSSVDPDLIPPNARAPYAQLQSVCGSFDRIDVIAAAIRKEYNTDHSIDFFSRAISADDHSLWRECLPGVVCRSVPISDHALTGAKRRSGRTSSEEPRRLDIKLTNKDHTSFARCLQAYAELGETSRPDPDNFQLPLYLASLETIGAALIEENEFTEERRLRSLVIAIDTSGSCARDLTRGFLEITRDILLREQLFFDRFDLRIMQCDDRLRRDDKIVSSSAFREYIDNLQIFGGGGTDFRPVFDRVAMLRKNGQLGNLSGILYFTDGLGIYPSASPDYKVTFAFPRKESDLIDVPAWVRRVVFE